MTGDVQVWSAATGMPGQPRVHTRISRQIGVAVLSTALLSIKYTTEHIRYFIATHSFKLNE